MALAAGIRLPNTSRPPESATLIAPQSRAPASFPKRG
jgi:hypothetical protein